MIVEYSADATPTASSPAGSKSVTWQSAPTRSVSSDGASSSLVSTSIHATGRCSRATNAAACDVLPYPAGAVITATLTVGPDSCSRTFERRASPSAGRGDS